MPKNLLRIILLSLCLSTAVVHAQYCTTDNRFTEKIVFASTKIKSINNVVYGSSVNWQGQTQSLTMDIRMPKPTVDTYTKIPFILMIHGGSFKSGKKEDLDNTCIYFAERGYVAATIDYRLGWDTLSCADTLTYYKAVYRALQDANAALRFIVANASTYRIDTNWIFIGGESAGSGTALGMVYNSQAELNQAFPSIHTLLGNLNNSGNTLTNHFTIKAIFNNWGGIYSQFYDDADVLPMISFHGDNDGVVPIDSALDISCLTVKPMIWGSRTLYNKSVALGVCSDLSVKHHAGHGVYNGNKNSTNFRIGRAACFFKSLFCNTCTDFYSLDSIPANCSATQSPRMSESETEVQSEFIIYPNPATTTLFIKPAAAEQKFTAEVYNSFGALVNVNVSSDAIDISYLSKGIYLLRIKTEEEVATKRFIKE